MLLEIIVRVKHRSPFTLIHKPNFIRTKNVAFIKQLVVVGGKNELAVGICSFCKVFHNALDHRRTQAAVYFVHHRLALLASIVECREQRQGTQRSVRLHTGVQTTHKSPLTDIIEYQLINFAHTVFYVD